MASPEWEKATIGEKLDMLLKDLKDIADAQNRMAHALAQLSDRVGELERKNQ